MWPGELRIELQPTVFKILRELIHDRAGLLFDEAKRDLLAEKLSPLVNERGFNSFLDYYYLLKYGPNAEQEWPNVLDALSVPETYFWREMDQIQAFVTSLVPKYVAANPDRPLRIWCGACCTGEEPLTILMALAEAGWLSQTTIELKASDASAAAIAKAQKGIYRERSFRALPLSLREKYFTPVAGGWQIDPAIHRRVEWSTANLMSGSEIASLANSPFIYCRNVFIYFSPEAIGCTVSRFAKLMERPGYLFIGAAESLLKITDEFELEQINSAFAYKLS
jgi:chemotaxis protein methyltransferase CheR